MNYWIHDKDGNKTEEGSDEVTVEKKQLVSKKFNDDLEEYWKKKKEEAAQAESAAQAAAATASTAQTAPTTAPRMFIRPMRVPRSRVRSHSTRPVYSTHSPATPRATEPASGSVR